MNDTQTTYGTVKHGNEELVLTQQPYLNGTGENPVYKAAAQDAAGNQYMVTWQVTDANCEDESEACDWKDYTVTQC